MRGEGGKGKEDGRSTYTGAGVRNMVWWWMMMWKGRERWEGKRRW